MFSSCLTSSFCAALKCHFSSTQMFIPGCRKSVCSIFVAQAEDSERREKNLEEAKKITIENDPNLPEPETVSLSNPTL